MKTMAAAAMTGLMMISLHPAPANAAPIQPSAIVAPSLLDQVACRMVRQRIVRPNGRVVFRTVRSCDRAQFRPNCRVKQVRTVRPNGRVIHRTIRTCR